MHRCMPLVSAAIMMKPVAGKLRGPSVGIAGGERDDLATVSREVWLVSCDDDPDRGLRALPDVQRRLRRGG